jgi:general secretion pathway protein E
MRFDPDPRPIDGFLAFLRQDPAWRERVNWDVAGDLGEGAADYRTLWQAGVLPAEELADAVALYHRLPRARAAEIDPQSDLPAGLSRRFLRESWIFPYRFDGGVALAAADPSATAAISAVALAVGRSAAVRVASFEEILALLERAADAAASARVVEIEPPDVEDELAGDESRERLEHLASAAPAVRAVSDVLDAAINLGATDIHIEPARDGLKVRLRVDGLLRPYQSFPSRTARAIVSRVKILAGLDIAERRLPQDGRAAVRVAGVEADLRVATMPTIHGEAAVIRILVKEARALDLERLGMSGRDLQAFREQLAVPHGLVVVSGPTGSGKTTTLAAALSILNSPQRKIMTIEDPIEYQIPGIHQTQVKPAIDLTFAHALRALLRHDPDIVMVGEMRDTETAQTGIQAALTGHLVLTTLHTNSATDSLARLIDLKVESFLLASTVRCIVGQRLVRKLCERCKAPSGRLDDAAAALVDRGILAIRPGDTPCTAPGCAWCGGTGYRGRVGIFEVLSFDHELRRHIHAGVEPPEIERLAIAGGMTTMLQDGLAKFRAGITSVEEVLRVTV